MAESAHVELSPWTGLWRRGRFGSTGPEPGVLIGEPARTAAALMAARKGQLPSLLKIAKAWGVELPASPRWVRGRSLTFAWAGPDQWLVRGPASFAEIEGDLASFAPHAIFIDQSHARATLTVGGPRARDALAKGFDVDLHPRVFTPGDVALTLGAQISAHLLQIDDRPTYEVAVPRSFAGSFWHWLSEAAAEYGYTIGSGTEESRPSEPNAK